MKIHNQNSLLLCLVGGTLMIISGVSGAIGVIGEITEILQYVFGLEFLETFQNFMTGLAAWAAFGGAVVIVGGMILTTSKVWFGRVLIGAGIIVGVVGLLMTLVQMASTGVFVMSFVNQLEQSLGWIGSILAFIARIIADQKPLVES